MEQKTILIVDDQAALRKILKFNLSKNNYNIIEATDGRIALDLLYKNKIDLVLLDLMMPKMDGLTFLDKLAEYGDYKDLPVIVISAKNDMKDVMSSYKKGALDYIKKPYDIKNVLEKIKKYIGEDKCQ